MISYSIFSISIVFCTLKNPQNDTKIIILPLLVKKLWNGLKRMAAILFLCKWGQKVLVGHASMSEMICMTINYNHAKLNNSSPICRVLSLTRPTSGNIINTEWRHAPILIDRELPCAGFYVACVLLLHFSHCSNAAWYNANEYKLTR